MMRPIFCGIEDCSPIDRRGNHGFMKSIEKNIPKDFDQNPSNLLKQKISLKHIANRHPKQTSTDHVITKANHCQTSYKEKKHISNQACKLQQSDHVRPQANNAISQYGESQQNRRNLICLKNNLNQPQIDRHVICQHQGQGFKNVSHIISNNIAVLNRLNTPAYNIQNRENYHSRKTVNMTKNIQFRPQSTLIEIPNLLQLNPQPHKQNLQTLISLKLNHEKLALQSKEIKQTPEPEFKMSPQGGLLGQLRSQKMIRKTQIIQHVNWPDQQNCQNHAFSGHSNRKQKSLFLGSTGKIEISYVKNPNLAIPKYKQSECLAEQKFNKLVLHTHFEQKNNHLEAKDTKIDPISPFKEIGMFLQINSNNKITEAPCKSSYDEILTRQNSKASFYQTDNPKNSMLTNGSYFSEYQNHKEFENRFNRTRTMNTSNFGVHSYLQQTSFNQAHTIRPTLTSQKQIMLNGNTFKEKPFIIDAEKQKGYDKILIERKENKNIERNLRKKTSLEVRELNLQIDATKEDKNEISIDCLELKEEDINALSEKKNDKSSRHKKNRSSFFEVIDKGRYQLNLTKTKTSNFTNTAKFSQSGEQLNQLSMFNMKNAQSFIESEQASSEEDSQLEYVFHSTSNVKLKSFALLKSMHAVKYEYGKNDCEK